MARHVPHPGGGPGGPGADRGPGHGTARAATGETSTIGIPGRLTPTVPQTADPGETAALAVSYANTGDRYLDRTEVHLHFDLDPFAAAVDLAAPTWSDQGGHTRNVAPYPPERPAEIKITMTGFRPGESENMLIGLPFRPDRPRREIRLGPSATEYHGTEQDEINGGDVRINAAPAPTVPSYETFSAYARSLPQQDLNEGDDSALVQCRHTAGLRKIVCRPRRSAATPPGAPCASCRIRLRSANCGGTLVLSTGEGLGCCRKLDFQRQRELP